MAPRRALRCLVAALALCATACKGKDEKQAGGAVDAMCEKLGKACGDNDKHSQKITDECKQAVAKQASCADKLSAVYDCYEKDVCGKADKVWALDDMRVLADRNNKCVAERNGVSECAPK
jgi:hypothetical protein